MLREVPDKLVFVPPIDLLTQIYRDIGNRTNEMKREIEVNNRHKTNEYFIFIGNRMFELKKAIDRYEEKLKNQGLEPMVHELRIIWKNLNLFFEKQGFVIQDLTGAVITDDLLENAEVIGWLPGDREEDYVIETYEPLIRAGDNVLQIAKITGSSRGIEKGKP